MNYVEHRPPAQLAPFVECIWFLDGGSAGPDAPVERILPDGCAEIIVQCGDPFRQLGADGRALSVQPRCFLAGVLTRFWLVQPTGDVSTMGIRLRPGGVGMLFGLPAAEVSNRVTPLDALWGRRASEFEERLQSAVDDGGRMAVAARWLGQVAVETGRRDTAVEWAAARLFRARGRVRIPDLARTCGLSPRQLQRRFRTAVGTGPKTLARIARFQDLLGRLRAGSKARWTDLALAAGYYDHAHLDRDFREFTGQSPSRFVVDEGALSRCFSSPERLASLLDA